MTMHEMRIFYYLFSIRLLDHQLEKVGAEMKLLADASEKGTLSGERLRQIRIHYDLVYELSNCINEVFGWSNVMNILYLFLRLGFDSAWAYWKIAHRGWVAVLGTRTFKFNSFDSEYDVPTITLVTVPDMIWLFLIILLIIYLLNATTKFAIKVTLNLVHF